MALLRGTVVEWQCGGVQHGCISVPVSLMVIRQEDSSFPSPAHVAQAM